jgi:hypothetical protein
MNRGEEAMAFNRFRIALVSIALGCALPTAGHAERTVVNCRLTNATKIVAMNQSLSTQSTAFVIVPGMATTFVQGKRGCVILELQAMPATQDNTFMPIDAVLDNNPNRHYLGYQKPYFGNVVVNSTAVRSYKLIWPNVGPGTHSVRLYYRTHTNSQIVWLHHPMMIVNYVK